MLYRQPAYLVCTDTNLNINKLLQAYLWRWEIEVNFRDEKSLLGCGKAQVRKETPVKKLPAFIVAIYALILLAAQRANNSQTINKLPRAKWYNTNYTKRQTTGDILNVFRSQLWAENASFNFSHFVNLQRVHKNRKNRVNPAFSASFYMRN